MELGEGAVSGAATVGEQSTEAHAVLRRPEEGETRSRPTMEKL